MSAPQTQMLDVGQGETRRSIAYIHSPPSVAGASGLVWLIGLRSDMQSTKAEALAEWTAARGLGFTRFDYSGHGRSSGRFEDATIGDWVEEAVEVFMRVTSGPQIVAGSSTGGHITLLLLRRLMETRPEEAARIKGLVLIAPAWDLTEELMWKVFPQEAQREIMEKGFWIKPSDYDEHGCTITRRFIEEGRDHLLARRPWDPGRPVAILQGLKDTDVPPAHARELMSFIEGGWASLTEVPDGEHRLSRPEDLALLYQLIEKQLSATAR